MASTLAFSFDARNGSSACMTGRAVSSGGGVWGAMKAVGEVTQFDFRLRKLLCDVNQYIGGMDQVSLFHSEQNS